MTTPATLSAAPGPEDEAARIAALIGACRYHYRDEDRLHAGIEQVLADGGVNATAEARLSGRDRIDFLAGPVGIEVKIAGSAADVTRQLRRYATHPEIGALVLVTTRARHRALPRQIGGKPLRVVFLSGVTG
jgi:hypothetical protein